MKTASYCEQSEVQCKKGFIERSVQYKILSTVSSVPSMCLVPYSVQCTVFSALQWKARRYSIHCTVFSTVKWKERRTVYSIQWSTVKRAPYSLQCRAVQIYTIQHNVNSAVQCKQCSELFKVHYGANSVNSAIQCKKCSAV